MLNMAAYALQSLRLTSIPLPTRCTIVIPPFCALHTEFSYQPGDWLLFGSETSGLPLQAHRDIEASGGELVKIPIVDTHVRSLNLAVSVGVAAFEALRQLDAGSHVVAPRTSPTLEEAERSYKERMQQQAGKSETLD